MLQSRTFWLIQGIGIVLFHLLALGVMIGSGQGFDHPLGMLWGIILLIHAGEIALAFIALKGMGVPPLTVVVKTLIFGFIWWLPRRLGVYQA
ncbi:MAG: hypothetical protein SVO96_08115 [Pseudomonadota bacterium]|nr:hypothetical protein [Pseudomonadota bacterium]